MLDGKVSIQHWDRRDIFLPFDAIGTWAYILEIDTAKKAWIDVLRWMEEEDHTIPENYTTVSSYSCVMSLGRIISRTLGLVSQPRRWQHSYPKNGYLIPTSIPCLPSLGNNKSRDSSVL